MHNSLKVTIRQNFRSHWIDPRTQEKPYIKFGHKKTSSGGRIDFWWSSLTWFNPAENPTKRTVNISNNKTKKSGLGIIWENNRKRITWILGFSRSNDKTTLTLNKLNR